MSFPEIPKMHRLLLVAGFAAAALVPSLASAQSGEQRLDRPSERTETPRDVNTRANWLEQHIRAAAGIGTLDRDEARRDLGELTSIRNQERDMRTGDGLLSRVDEATLQQRLVGLFSRLGEASNQE